MFRQEAIQQQTQRLHGEVVLLPTISSLWLSVVLVSFVSLAITLLVFGSFPRKASVAGIVQPQAGVSKVYGERAGIVRQVPVQVGQLVEQGEPLIVVNGDQYLDDGRSLDAELIAALERDQQRLTLQRERLVSRQPIELQQINARIAAAEQDITLLNQQLEALAQRQAINAEQLSNAQRLQANGHIGSEQVIALEKEQASLVSEQASLSRAKANQNSEIALLTQQRSLLPNQQQDELAAIEQQLERINQQLLQQNAQRGYVIKAPISGKVASLQVRVGQQVPLNQPALTIVPANADYQAELLVPVRDAGFLANGQTVSIRYDAYPFQKFGLYQGSITRIERSVLLPNEVTDLAIPIQEPVYRVKVALAQQWVDTFGEQTELTPGMTLQADITLEERSLLEWMLEPIISLKGRI